MALSKAAKKFNAFYRKRDEAIERLIVAWNNHQANEDDEDAQEELNFAADELALAHVAMTFEIHH
jgi:hypothetical protein